MTKKQCSHLEKIMFTLSALNSKAVPLCNVVRILIQETANVKNY